MKFYGHISQTIKTKQKNLVLNKKLEERCPKGRLMTEGNGVTEISHIHTDRHWKKGRGTLERHTYRGV